MRFRTTRRKEFRRSLFGLTAAAGFFAATMASAQTDGTWIGTGGSALWSDSNMWFGGNIANGVGATADLSTVSLTSNQLITLDMNVTLGVLDIGDLGGQYSYTIGNGGFALTFDNSSNF